MTDYTVEISMMVQGFSTHYGQVPLPGNCFVARIPQAPLLSHHPGPPLRADHPLAPRPLASRPLDPRPLTRPLIPRPLDPHALTPRGLTLLDPLAPNPLIPRGLTLKKCHGKTTIFLALDNLDRVSATRALVERVLWGTINDDANTYQAGDYHYSPTDYVTRMVLRGPEKHAQALHRLPKDHGAVDRYYATIEMEQPDDAKGLPDDIREFKEKRNIREKNLAE